MKKSQTQELIDEIKALREEIARLRMTPVYVPYPVSQPYPVPERRYYGDPPYYQPITTPHFPNRPQWEITCGDSVNILTSIGSWGHNQ